MFRTCLILALLLGGLDLYAQEALVDGAWLKRHLSDEQLYLLDIQAPERYRRAHVPGAVNAPYAFWRTDKQSSNPGMLPPIARLEAWFGELGIANDSHVVIVATGGSAAEMAAASRVFWTFKVMGHRSVSLLDGGLVIYANEHQGTLEQTPSQRAPTSYRAIPPDRSVNIDATEIEKSLKLAPLLDARTLGEYMGVIVARSQERAGTLPGAHHLPFDWLVDGKGRLRSRQQIVTLFEAAGIDPSEDGTIHFCHSGNRAALTWFVDYALLGHQDARLYDGSMSEWAQRRNLPIETRFRF